jgi:hypothetical protein
MTQISKGIAQKTKIKNCVGIETYRAVLAVKHGQLASALARPELGRARHLKLHVCAPLATAQTWHDATDFLHRRKEVDMPFIQNL